MNFNNFLIIFAFTLFINCKAQNPVITIESGCKWGQKQGAYYKDNNNYYNPFVGTWVFDNGTTKLTIVLQKREMIYTDVSGGFYTDRIVGEYKYEVNGVTLINTLDNINNTNVKTNAISGINLIKPSQYPACNDCSFNEKRLDLRFKNSNLPLVFGYIVVRKKVINGVNFIEIHKYSRDSIEVIDDFNEEEPADVPGGTYLLQQQ